MHYTLRDPRHLHQTHHALSPTLSLRQIMDRLVDFAFVAPAGPAGTAGGVGSPALNAYDDGDYLVVEAQLPGMRPEDIDVSIEQGMLTIQGKTQEQPGHEERTYLSHEYQIGSFSRSVRLPDAIDADGVEATYDHGVLHLTLPKAARTKVHHIRIASSDQNSVMGSQDTESGTPEAVVPGVSDRSL
jgi:HSP20 family protein